MSATRLAQRSSWVVVIVVLVSLAAGVTHLPAGELLEEGFEAGLVPPAGWTAVDTHPYLNWEAVSSSNSPQLVHSGLFAARVLADPQASSDEWLRSPILDLTDIWNARVVFWVHSDTSGCPSQGGPGARLKLHVTDANHVVIATPWDMCRDAVWSTTEYRQVAVDLIDYHDQEIRLAWQYVGSAGQHVALDEVVVSGVATGPVHFLDGPWDWYAHPDVWTEPESFPVGAPSWLCAAVGNFDDQASHAVTLEFGVAPRGIGVPYAPAGAVTLTVSAGAMDESCVQWFPSGGGERFVEARMLGDALPSVARRNLEMVTGFSPGAPSTLPFLVGNPTGQAVTVTLGFVPSLPGWGLELAQDVIPNLAPGAVVTETVSFTPPDTLPSPATAVGDVQGFVGGELLGAFRVVHYPPHIFADGFESGLLHRWSAAAP